jgi:hypothetical protein
MHKKNQEKIKKLWHEKLEFSEKSVVGVFPNSSVGEFVWNGPNNGHKFRKNREFR